MPLRPVLLLLCLFLACLAIAGLSYAMGWELYMFGSRRPFHVRPPSDPTTIPFHLLASALVFLVSRSYGLLYLTFVTACVLIGSVWGWIMFQWMPTLAQHALSVALIVTLAYGWTHREDFE